MPPDVFPSEMLGRIVVCTMLFAAACTSVDSAENEDSDQSAGTTTASTTAAKSTTSAPIAGTMTTSTSLLPPSVETPSDCYSGARENEESRNYTPEIIPVTAPAGVQVIPMDGLLVDISAGDSGVWAAVATAGIRNHTQLVRIDPEAHELSDAVDFVDAGSLVVGEEEVWVTQFWRDTVVAVEPSTMAQRASASLPPLPPDVAPSNDDRCNHPRNLSLGAEALWVYGRGTIVRINPVTGDVEAMIEPATTVPVLSKGAGIATGLGHVWVAGNGRDLFRIDPETNSWEASTPVAAISGHWVQDVAIAGDHVWVSGRSLARNDEGNREAMLSMIDPVSEEVMSTWRFENEGSSLAASAGRDRVLLWENGVGLWVIEDGELAEQPILCTDVEVWLIAVSGNVVWASPSSAGEIWRFDLGNPAETCPPR